MERVLGGEGESLGGDTHLCLLPDKTRNVMTINISHLLGLISKIGDLPQPYS